MMVNFEQAYEFTKRWEGGYVNDPADPGGETKYGISKRAYPDLNIKDLGEEDAKAIYKRDYWDMLNCDNRPLGLGVAVFDTAVNCGLARAAVWLDDTNTAEEFLAHRKTHYDLIIKKNPKLERFRKGWMNRLNDLHGYISRLEKSISTLK
jgi:hypothetical protein